MRKKKQNFQGNNFKDVLKDVNVDGWRFSFPFKFNNKKKTYKLLFNFQTVIENNLKILFMYVTPQKKMFSIAKECHVRYFCCLSSLTNSPTSENHKIKKNVKSLP